MCVYAEDTAQRQTDYETLQECPYLRIALRGTLIHTWYIQNGIYKSLCVSYNLDLICLHTLAQKIPELGPNCRGDLLDPSLKEMSRPGDPCSPGRHRRYRFRHCCPGGRSAHRCRRGRSLASQANCSEKWYPELELVLIQ